MKIYSGYSYLCALNIQTDKYMSLISFGEYMEGTNYKVLDERIVRGSAGVMFLLGIVAFINGFIIKNYIVIPYISGVLALSFMIAVFINPKFSPTVFIATLMVSKQSRLPIGAIQKGLPGALD
jgi:hypothetical protein